MLERGPHRPPDVARILHHAGLHQRIDIGVELLLGAKQLRHAGARQLVVGRQPIALEPGRPRAPERRRGRKRNEQRQIGQHPRHHVDPVVGVRQLDMHVQPAQHVALADHLQVVHHRVVALALGLLRPAPVGGRMRAGGEDGEAVVGRDLRHGLAQMAKLGVGGADVVMRQRRHLALRLQEFAHDLAVGRLLGDRPERSWACRASPAWSLRRPGNTLPRCRMLYASFMVTVGSPPMCFRQHARTQHGIRIVRRAEHEHPPGLSHMRHFARRDRRTTVPL